MELKKASRKQMKIKIGIAGSSGSGKTTAALLIAFGITKDWSKIAVIDTENRSSELYVGQKMADTIIGEFNVIPLSPPYTPERYIEAISVCEKEPTIEVIIIDSISHEWDGKGGILEISNSMTGNSFTNWGKLTPRHNYFIDKIIQSPKFIISTMRSKQDYVMTEKNGKQVPEKVGLKAITREGVDYEMTLCFDIDIKHNAVSSKDRTAMFMDKPDFLISAKTGEKILEWCNKGEQEKILSSAEAIAQLNACANLDSLRITFLSFTDGMKVEMMDLKNQLKIKLSPVLPALIEGSEDFHKMKKLLEDGATLDEIELKYFLSDTVKLLLIP